MTFLGSYFGIHSWNLLPLSCHQSTFIWSNHGFKTSLRHLFQTTTKKTHLKFDMDLEKEMKTLLELRKKWCYIVRYVNSHQWFYQLQEGVDTIFAIIAFAETWKQIWGQRFLVLSVMLSWHEKSCVFLHQQILNESLKVFYKCIEICQRFSMTKT